MHIEAIGFSATAAAAAGSIATALPGDSLTIKNATPGTHVLLLDWYADHQSSLWSQLIWPGAHDTTRNLRSRIVASEVRSLISLGIPATFLPQDPLSATIAGGAVAGDVDTNILLLLYEDFPTIKAKLLTLAQLSERTVRITSIEATITTLAGPGWSGAELINAESNLLRANTDYAIMGATIGVECAALGIRSPDFGGARIAIPGNDLSELITQNYFTTLSQRFNRALIPVINSGNKDNILIDAAQDENAAAVPFTLHLAELTGTTEPL